MTDTSCFSRPSNVRSSCALSVVKINKTLKLLFKLLFHIVSKVRIILTILPMQLPWLLLDIHSGIFGLFRKKKNRKFRENVVMPRAESIFTGQSEMLYFMCLE